MLDCHWRKLCIETVQTAGQAPDHCVLRTESSGSLMLAGSRLRCYEPSWSNRFSRHRGNQTGLNVTQLRVTCFLFWIFRLLFVCFRKCHLHGILCSIHPLKCPEDAFSKPLVWFLYSLKAHLQNLLMTKIASFCSISEEASLVYEISRIVLFSSCK